MFGGFYRRRRRLKNLSLWLFTLLTLLVLVYRQREIKQATLPASIRTSKWRTPAPSFAFVRKPPVLSSLEVVNSPYLSVVSVSSNTIPVIVLSKAANIEVRDAIRRTWGFSRLYRDGKIRIRTFFIVGIDDFYTERIHMEQNVFDDVIQVNIPDLYSFNAHKELAAMIWIQTYLPKCPFYLKAEDDVIINMRVLVQSLLPLIDSVYNQEIIIGWFGLEHTVLKGTSQRFTDATVPATGKRLDYAMNLLYVVTRSAAVRLIEKLHHVEQIEYPGEPFVTGILRDAAKVQITDLGSITPRFKYNLANGLCDEAFESDDDLLVCTSSLRMGSKQSMPEYFDAWNMLIGEKQ